MISIGGVSVTPKDQIVIDRNKLEERDSGFITVLTTRQERYETYDLVELTLDGNTEQMLVQADVVTKYKNDLYQHEVTLIEAVARFDAYYPADRPFTSLTPKSIGDILNVYKTELERYHGISIDFNDQAGWVSLPIRQKEFVGVNFSVILQDLFKSINAIPRATYFDGVWTITPQFYNERNNLIDIVPQSQIVRQNNQDYATRIKSQLKNAVNDNAVWFPSVNGYITPKSSTPQKVTSRLQYTLDSNIADIIEALAVDVEIFLPNNTTDTFTIDISKYIVPKEVYDGLRTPASRNDRDTNVNDGLHKKNTVQYNIGDRFITDLFVANAEEQLFGFSEDVQKLKLAIINAGLDSGQLDEAGGVAGHVVNTDLEDIKLRIKYVRQRDLDFVHHRQYLKNMNDSTQTHRQRDSFVDIERYKTSLRAIINRMGNEVKEETKTFPTGQIAIELGDYDSNNFVVVRVKRTYYNQEVLYEYMLAENFGNIDADTSLWREPSAFEIQQKDITTNLIIEEFVEISDASETVDTRLTADGIETILSVFDTSLTNHGYIHAGLLRTVVSNNTDVSVNGIYLPVFSSGGGNTTTFHVNIDDPISAGRGFIDAYENGEFGIDFIYTYDNDDPLGNFGELKEFKLFFFTDLGKSDTGLYPIADANETTLYLNNALTNTNILDRIDKDSNAKFGVTFQQHYVTDRDYIIVNDGFTKYNRLVSDLTRPPLKLVKGIKPFTLFDVVMRDTDTVLSGSLTLNENLRQLNITANETAPYYAIAFGDELVLSFNKQILVGTTETYYINFKANADRVPSNQLETPLLTTFDTTDATITASLFNINDEAVNITATLDGTTFVTEVDATGSSLEEQENATAVFNYSGLDPNTTYPLVAQITPLAGSTKVASFEGTYNIITDIIPLFVPVYTPSRTETYEVNSETYYKVYFDVSNDNPFALGELDVYIEFPDYGGVSLLLGQINPNQTKEFMVQFTNDDVNDTANWFVEDLAYNFQFQFRTRDFTNDWFSDKTVVDTFTITEQDAPTYVSTLLGVTTLQTNWSNPNANSTTIQVELYQDDPTTILQTKTESVSDNVSITFDNLQPQTNYDFRAKFLETGFNTASGFTNNTATTLAQIQTVTPSIEARDITTSTIDVRLTNNANYPVSIQYDLNSNYSTSRSIALDPNEVRNLNNEYTGLSPSTNYTLYARAIRTDDAGYTYSSSTTDAFKTATPLYDITFDANGGTWADGSTSDKVVVNKETGDVISSAPLGISRSGYNFTGWNPSLPYTVQTFDETLQAGWQEITPLVVRAKSNFGNPVVQINTPNEQFQDALTQTYQVIDDTIAGGSTYSITVNAPNQITVGSDTYVFSSWRLNGTSYGGTSRTFDNLTTDSDLEAFYILAPPPPF